MRLAAWVVAAILLYRGGNAIRNAFAARHWPPTIALVTESAAGFVEVPRSLHQSMWKYVLRLRYTYSVNGRGYTGSRTSFGPWGDEENMNPFAAGMSREYPAGGRVTIHYDPSEPSRSVISPVARVSSWIAFALGLMFVWIGWRPRTLKSNIVGPSTPEMQ